MTGMDARRALRVLGLVLPLLAAAGGALADDDPVVATLNGTPIHRSEVVAAYEGSPFQRAPLDQVFQQVVEYVITTRLLAAEAEKNKLGDDPQVKAEIEADQASIMAQAYLERRTAAAVSPDDVRKRYDDLVKTAPAQEEMHLFHIVVASEADANAVVADLKGGAKFGDEAKAKSSDPDAKSSGGDLGYFSTTELAAVPGFTEAVAKLQPGQYSDPINTQFGWQVVLVSERRPRQPPSFEDSRDGIATTLRQEAARKVVADLAGGARIQRFGQDGKPLPPATGAPTHP